MPNCSPLVLLIALAACRATDASTEVEEDREFAARTSAQRHLEGFIDVFVDDRSGELLLALPAPRADGVALECLYVEGLTSGLGSNPIGLDRGQLGETRLVAWRVVADRVLLEERNTGFRAESPDAAERAATRDSFAPSILWAGDVVARDDAGRVLVDVTSFAVRDAHRVAATLAAGGEGRWSLDDERSVLDTAACHVFPDNLFFEALLTFAGEDPGREVRSSAADPHAVTLVQHHALIRLPDDGYRPRVHDPRNGAFSIGYADYSAELADALEKRFSVRHRLEKLEPEAARSRVVEPIVYYVDPGVPEPVRSALIEGASWWAAAFDAAGFVDAYRVELLPAGVHPLDVRYNVIQWVHRATRGWSYGGGVTDPRTGEMIKGHVNLGSLRVRQDRLLFEGLLGAERTGTGAPDDPIELALARIRQLSAHEVGHTLGLAHNFAASTYAGRASVMDYPAPLVQLDANGRIDASAAYGVGVGAWDVHAIRCLYAPAPPGVAESDFLDSLAREAREAGYLFLSDADARPLGSAHPLANLWDNGTNPAAELERVLDVRRAAIAQFGARSLAAGRPLAELQEVFAPVYFHHRYQLEAALKSIGGARYRHALRGDDARAEARIEPVSAAEQLAALSTMLSVLAPEELDVPDSVLATLAPRPPGVGRNREMLASRHAEPLVDSLGMASAAARALFAGLLEPARLTRVHDFAARGLVSFGVSDLLERVEATVFDGEGGDARRAALRAAVAHAFVAEWTAAARSERLAPALRAELEGRLAQRREQLEAEGATDPQLRWLADEIGRFLERGVQVAPGSPASPPLPPGSPIGSAQRGCSLSPR